MIAMHLVCALLVLHDPHVDSDVCKCENNRIEGGWCEKCDVGYCAGLRFTSRKFGEALDFHGHQVGIESTACPQCRKLIKSGGFCESCKMGFVGGRGYFSRVCYQLARGKPIGLKSSREIAVRKKCCPADGWCDKCNTGIVGNRIYTDKRDYELTVRSIAALKKAIETSTRCESCAEAMIADSRCPLCRITYKDALPVKTLIKDSTSPPEPRHSAPTDQDSRNRSD